MTHYNDKTELAEEYINDQKKIFDMVEAQKKFRNQSFGLEIRRLWSEQTKFMFSQNTTFDRMLQEINMKVLEDDDRFYYEQFWLLKHSFLSEPLVKLIMECQQYGIVDYLIRKNIRDPLKARDDKDPKVLTMFMLSAGFIVWLGTVLVACIAFFGEILHHKLRKIVTDRREVKRLEMRKNKIKSRAKVYLTPHGI